MKLLARKRDKVIAALGVIVIIGIIGAIALNHWANSSSTQMITIKDTPVSNTPSKPEYQPLQTAFFSTQVPKTWHIQGGLQANSTTVQEVAFAPSGSNGQVGFTSDVLPSDGLAGVGDYHLRTSDPTYTSFTDPSFPASALAFKNVAGPLNYTAFITHGNRYAAISVSDEGSPDDAIALLRTILGHWSWQ